jgi:hypothetical protein
MLKINGNDIIKILNISPGPKIGKILAILLEEVLEDPKKNNKDYLKNRVLELNKLSDGELEKLKQKALSLKEEFEADIENKLKKKYYV